MHRRPVAADRRHHVHRLPGGGDVVALARDNWVLVTPEREPGPSRLAAYHGSLTATELAIPLLLARGRALDG